MKHLKIGGSTAARTLACPNWLEQAGKLPKPKSSNYADEGNLLHDAMEAHYRDGKSFEQLLYDGLTYEDQKLTEDHVTDLLEPARNMVEAVLDKYKVEEYFCEVFVQYEEGEIGGSVDLLGISKNKKTLVNLDYKFGQNKVKAKDNKQMLFYLMCAKKDKQTAHWFEKLEKLVCVIVQPKCSHDADIWETDIQAIADFERELFLALGKLKHQESGRHCQYCPAAATCNTKRKEAKSALVLPKNSAAHVSEALLVAAQLEGWIKEVRGLAQQYMEQGVQVPAHKLVEKRAVRKWTDPDAVYDQVKTALPRKEVYKETILSPAQMEKALKKAKAEIDLGQFIKAGSSGVTIAHVEDRRPAVSIAAPKNLQKIVDKKSNKK